MSFRRAAYHTAGRTLRVQSFNKAKNSNIVFQAVCQA